MKPVAIIPQSKGKFYEEHFGDFPRFKISISTDKDTYKPGETVYIRAIILECNTHVPFHNHPDNGKVGQFWCRITSPRDEELKNLKIDQENSVFSFEWVLEEDISGGQYQVELYTKLGQGCPPSNRNITINKYNPPRFKKTLEFLQKGYSESDEVTATLKVERTEGGFPDPEQTKLEASCRLDGEEFFRTTELTLSAIGKVEIKFELPRKIAKGIGSLNVAITEGLTENVSKTLPVILKELDCHIYPEGGEIINGALNGVYVEAFTPSKDPADFEAELLKISPDGEKSVVGSNVLSLHEGRGYFQFTPEKGCDYELHILKPSGVTNPIPLPKAVEKGLGLFVQNKDELEFGKKIQVFVADPENLPKRTAYVGLFKREKEIEVQKVDITGITKVSLDPGTYDGVLRVLVVDGGFTPCAERLIFIPPKETMEFEVVPSKDVYAPGDHVKLTIKTSHPGTLCVHVSDDAVYKMKEKRERAARLPALQFFQHEVKELYDSDSYFLEDPDDERKVPPKIKRDLLLGTQGWRRFVFCKPEEYMRDEDDKKKAKMMLNVECDPEIEKNRILKERRMKEIEEMKKMIEEVERMRRREEECERCKCEEAKAGGREKEEEMRKVAEMEKMRVMEEKEKHEIKAFVDPPKDAGIIIEEVVDKNIEPSPIPVPEKVEEPIPIPIIRADDDQPIAEVLIAGDLMMEKEEAEEEEYSEDEDEDEDEDEEVDLRMALDLMIMEEEPPVPVSIPYKREYAHQCREGRQAGDREDFTETLFFNCYKNVDVDEEVSIEFDLNDAVSTFCVFIDAFTNSGVMGFSNTFIVQSLSPFFLEPKMPLELTFGDRFFLPVAVNSNMAIPLQTQISIDAPGLVVKDAQFKESLEPYQRLGKYVEMKLEPSEGKEVKIKVSGDVHNSPLKDMVTRSCKIYPFGFPSAVDFSGKLGPNEAKNFKFPVAQDVIHGSLDTLSLVYPSPLSSIMEGVESLIQQPGGCFEQTSMTMYPMILAVKYMKMNDKVDEGLFKKANKFLESGLKKLMSYECKNGGYEWFGSDPGHEALTSMGVLEFTDLSHIYPVDQEMIKRTVEWLASRLKDDGTGFLRNSQALDYFGGAPEDVTDSYILYAMSRSKAIPIEKLTRVIDRLEKDCETKDDSYFISLVGLALHHFGLRDRAKKVVDLMMEKNFQIASGLVERSNTSITSSGGEDLQVQTTALAVMNMLNFKDEYMDEAEAGINFIQSKNRGGRFGSTQATVLALESMVKFAEATAVAGADGVIEMEVNGQKLVSKAFQKGNEESIRMEDFGRYIQPGKENEITLKMVEGSKMPFSIQVNYFTPKPVVSETEPKLGFYAMLRDGVVKEGDLTEVDVKLENLDHENAKGMTCVVINLPSGLVARMKNLEELKKKGVVDHFELMGSRKLVIYWRQLLKGEKKAFLVEVTGDIPGVFTAMASYAYLYYDDLNKEYVDGLKVKVMKKE